MAEEDLRTNVEKTTLFNIPPAGPNCDDESPTGRKSTRFDYVVKTINNGGRFYEECEPWLYGNMQVDNLQINGTATGTFQGSINVQSWKGFDIKHPTKPNHRLRHICLEGPEAGIYIRGRLTENTVIVLPEYWKGLIDPESITVHLTAIGYSQDLIVEKIEWGQRVVIKSNSGDAIDCFYEVKASRIDGEPLIVEYEGETPKDYPGDFSQFSISGYDY
jgi:hypothetical protein